MSGRSSTAIKRMALVINGQFEYYCQLVYYSLPLLFALSRLDAVYDYASHSPRILQICYGASTRSVNNVNARSQSSAKLVNNND